MPDFRSMFAPQETEQKPDFRSMFAPSDMALSAASGVQRGMTGLAGLPGDVRSLAAKGVEAATGMELPEVPSWIPAFVGGIPTGAKTTEQLQRGLEASGLPVHEPQTTAGEYARTVGEFAPAAIGGPGSLLRRAAQAVVPALTSETAGQVARQVAPEYENAARVAGGIAGIVPSARAAASKIPKGAILAKEELEDMARLAYKRSEQAGLVVKGGRGGAWGPMIAHLTYKLKKEGIDPTIHPAAWAGVNRLIQVADNPQTLEEIDTLRKVVRGASKSANADERRLGHIMVDRIDEFLDDLKPKDISAGDIRQGVLSLREARSIWHRMKKTETIDDMLERAGLRAGQFSVSGKENAIRTEFRQLAMKMTRDKRTRNMFTPEEQKLIKQLGNMGSAVNILRTIGKLAPRSALMIGGGAAVGYYGDPAVTGAAWGVGTAAQLAALGLTKRKVGQLRARVGGVTPIPGAPASPLAAGIAGQASTIPWRDQ